MQNPISIAVVGNGHAGNFLSRSLQSGELKITQYSRSAADGTVPLIRLQEEIEKFTLVLLCVNDDSIVQLSDSVPASSAIVAHVSGSRPLQDISNKHSKRGIFYPLMSLSADSPPDIRSIPFCLEASEEETYHTLEEICQKIGAASYRIDSRKRKHLHLAAVLSQNFSNYLYQLAYEELQKVDLPMDILKPLLLHNIGRLDDKPPINMQTGPAVRNDIGTMQSQLQMLGKDERELYNLLSRLIKSKYEKEL